MSFHDRAQQAERKGANQAKAKRYELAPHQYSRRTGIRGEELVALERGEFTRLKQLLRGSLEEQA